jgi:hypothetical protein
MATSIRFMYLRSSANPKSKGNPVGCIAMRINSNKEIEYQISVQSSKDEFDRDIGRTIAQGRLENNPVVIKSSAALGEKISAHSVTAAVMADILARKTPTKAKKAALAWLELACLAQRQTDSLMLESI